MQTKASIYLRSLAENDLDRTLAWHNDTKLYDMLLDGFRFVGRVAETDWLRHKAGFNPNEVNLAICLTGTDEHIGNIYLRQINWVARSAALGIFLGSSQCRGKGYGQAAVKAMLWHAFRELNLNRVSMAALADNAISIHVCERCGFVHEGRLRQAAFKAGSYRDVAVMSVLAEFWKANEGC